MSSPFNPVHQSKDLDARIIVALERISEAFRVMLWEAGKKNKLSPIQVQLLIFLNYHDSGHCTITCLSEEFAMSKPTISEVVKTLENKGLVQKVNSEKDSRSFHLTLSSAGKNLAEALEHFTAPLSKNMNAHSREEKQRMYDCLLNALTGLRKDGVIRRQRMCPTCEHLQNRKSSQHCLKLKKDMIPSEYLIDCHEHLEHQDV